MNDTVAPQLIYLVRHGRTHLNAEGRLRGRADPQLDDTGRHEAARTAAALTGSGIVGVVTSPLARAVQTAVAIEGRLHVQHVVDPRLADRDYGPQTGRTEAEVAAEFGSLDAAPGVEPSADLARRAMAALSEAAGRFAPDPVAVVSP
ncbi:MAG: histidine phosphatase family protein [Acidipropionibacterium sp.]|jgi:probable phosphoglycerate mutase|nr:histidine phosphatase family protein [Acidipropionibacterium sp.]